MPGIKRSAPDQDPKDAADIHPSRKRRVEQSEADAELSKLYGDLADDVQAVRLKAAGQLVKNLSTKSDVQAERLEAATSRLIKGLCSGRKGARLGFSVALSEVLRLYLNLNNHVLAHVVELIRSLTSPEGNFSGQERRDHLLGRRFAFQSVLQSDVALKKTCSSQQWRGLQDAIAQLAAEKPWVRRECGQVLVEYLNSPSGKKISNERLEAVVGAWQEAGLLKTPEGVAIWLTLQEHPALVAVNLPNGVWHSRYPLHSKERSALAKVMLNASSETEDQPKNSGKGKTAGAREAAPSIAWTVILSYLYRRSDEDAFENFWGEVVERGLFAGSASVERRSLGLNVVSLALVSAPQHYVTKIISPRALRCILDQRADPSRYLYEAAKVTLNDMSRTCAGEGGPASAVMDILLTHAGPNVDQLTKTKTLESLVSQASPISLEKIVGVVDGHLQNAKGETSQQIDDKRRKLADLLLTTVRTNRTPDRIFDEDGTLATWSVTLLHVLVQNGYTTNTGSRTEPLSDSTRATCRSRLMSCLNVILESKLELAVQGPQKVAGMLLKTADLALPLADKAEKALQTASAKIEKLEKQAAKKKDASHYAFQLLFHMSVVQVYNDEPDSVPALEDLCTSWDSWQQSAESSTMILELLLSFVSKNSALFRKLAEQAFSAFAADMSAEGLQSMLDVLGQKESLAGQQELFDQGDDDAEEDETSEEDDGEAVDVEDDSDVELVNGEQAEASDSEEDSSDESDSETSDSAQAGASSAKDEDEEAAFDRKLAAALGTAGMDTNNNDSDSDGSDMDDEQMMQLESHLSTIFAERAKTSSKKHDNAAAKTNILNFKNRVLDLLTIYVKLQPANPLALDLLLPLCTTIRTTSSKPTAEKAFATLKTYFESSNKQKTLPRPDDGEACFAVLSEVHDELKRGGSRLHANACSRASLFLSKVLVGLDAGNYGRVVELYGKLQVEWWLDAKSKVQASVFTEFTSWSIGTRKGR
ncbi:hypothetical protein MBLNU230_g7838t1 [Neophaeotheca triangularis]